MSGIASNIHELTGISSGSNDPDSYEPVNRLRAPGSDMARVASSLAPYPTAAAPSTVAPRRKLRRDTSVGRRRILRAATCHTARGVATKAAPTWNSIAVKGPAKTRPAECASPAASDTSTSTPNAIDAQRPGRGRRTPRRAIIDFHGSRSRIATPLVAWRISDHRAGEVANEKAIQPV